MSIQRYSQDQTTNFVGHFVPSGRATAGKNCPEFNLYKLIKAIGGEFKRFQDLMATFLEELDPRTTSIFLESWESALSIPDDCIPLATTVAERRENIVLKLASLAIQTEDDLKNLASLFGFTISFESDDGFPYTFPFEFTDGSGPCGGFPYTFPFILSSETAGKYLYCIIGDFDTDPDKAEIFQCLVRKLAPMGYKVAFVNS